MTHELRIITGSTTPIFRQIVDQIRFWVAVGQLKSGDALPSVRALAEQLLVNPNTIAKAYAELARDRVIETRQGKGVFVAEPCSVFTASERIRRLEPSLETLAREAISSGFSAEEVCEMLRKRYTVLRKDVRS